ncbi:MAG: MBL fold metallo-hydrolase [Clostridia bacterium]|nr:MBL fold metallo-hydrolase [Clostridia bacterium]
MYITWLGQSGYILNDGKTEICIDPYLSDAVNRLAGRPRTKPVPIEPEDVKSDVIICTHNHLDHIDIDAIPKMNKENILFLAPSCCEEVLRELGVKNYKPFDNGTVIEVSDFKINAVFADHTVPAIGVLVEHKGKRLYFSGDTFYNERLESIICDYVFICINGKLGNMTVEEAIRLTEKIQPTVAVPNHYDMFESNSENPERFDVPNRFIMEFNMTYKLEELRG